MLVVRAALHVARIDEAKVVIINEDPRFHDRMACEGKSKQLVGVRT